MMLRTRTAVVTMTGLVIIALGSTASHHIARQVQADDRGPGAVTRTVADGRGPGIIATAIPADGRGPGSAGI
ncbi:hypothetical protein ACWDDN_16480 [Streptomyces griseoruber]